MKDARLLEILLKKYGRKVTVTQGGVETPCCALVTPLRYKNKMYLDADVTDFGILDNTRLLYIGPANPDFSKDWANTCILVENKKHFVTRADIIYWKNEPLYIWAVLGNYVEE